MATWHMYEKDNCLFAWEESTNRIEVYEIQEHDVETGMPVPEARPWTTFPHHYYAPLPAVLDAPAFLKLVADRFAADMMQEHYETCPIGCCS